MKRAAEFTVFAVIAALIHVALFAKAPESGVRSSGAGGDAMVSIQAADATMAAMVKAWERPPQIKPQIETGLPEPLPEAHVPVMPEIELAQAPQAAVQTALVKPEEAETLEVDTAPPPPPEPEPEPEPGSEPEPAQRPAREPEPQQPQAKPDPKPAPEQPQTRKAEQTSAGQAAQQAAGSGGNTQAGQAGGSQTATADAGRQAKLRNIWGNKIRARVEHRKRRPAGVDGSGRSVVRLTVARNGQLVSYRIVHSSGNAAFDQAALNAVARAGKFPKAPKKLQVTQSTFEIPMSFQ